MLPASVAGALAAMFVVLLVLALRRVAAGATRLDLAGRGAGPWRGWRSSSLLDRLADERAAAERARASSSATTDLAAQALAPGSHARLPRQRRRRNGGKRLRERGVRRPAKRGRARSPMSSARLALLGRRARFCPPRQSGLCRHGSPGLRRSIELDRFGIAAHVLSSRDGCTRRALRGFRAAARHQRAQGQSARARLQRICRPPRRGLEQRAPPPAAEKLPPVASASRAAAQPQPAVASVPQAPSPPSPACRCRAATISPPPPRSRR